MEVRFLSVLLTTLLVCVLCDAQTQEEDSHICVRLVSVPKTKIVNRKCRKGSNEICTRTIMQIVEEKRAVCCEGWTYSPANRKCVPNCKRGCRRGVCIAPEICMCEPPLILKNNITCEEPQCNPSCVNSICVDDDKCNCSKGFVPHNATHCAPVCLEGFINNPVTLNCEPKCEECINGYCSAPNTCTCDDGYINQNSICVPRCSQSCKNGRCVAPNTCECNPGYNMNPSNNTDITAVNECQPICENTCVNGTCVKPNECACLTGYEYSTPSACKPKCDHCDHGECVAPNQCQCLDGYIKNGEKCTPICSKTCSNGYCSAPNTCTCNSGYELDIEDRFKCIPICKDSCVNATCTSPDTCTCQFGFEKVNHTVCRPFCASCENGVCVSPDVCQCNDGFIKTNGVCKPFCTSPCMNGFCESPEKCGCNEGYIKNETQSVCYKPCSGECNNGNCDINGICICDSPFELFNNSCIMPDSCADCNATCPDDDCRCEDGRPCHPSIDMPAESITSASLAGLQLTWVLGGCVGILLITIVIITIGYIWKKRKEYGEKPVDNGSTYPSVAYTIPNTLIQNNYDDYKDDCVIENNEDDTKKDVSLQLLEADEDADEKIAL